MKPKHKPLFGLLLTAALLASAAFVLLDTFVIPRPMPQVQNTTQTLRPTASPASQSAALAASETASVPDANTSADAVLATETSYTGGGLAITIETARAHDTTFYVADIRVDDPLQLKTALAQGTFGRNIKQTTSAMAVENAAILAINGDYYGFRDSGYVIRGGTLYRDTPRRAGDDEALVINSAGDFSIIRESETSAQALLDAGARQVFSFGPGLVVDGQVAVTAADEVSQSKTSNPRTAIAQVAQGHYLILVSNGRTDESAGLSLQQLAQELAARGAVTAYNLDGGGSSTLVFNGKILNAPAGGRGGESERQVSDIVYFG